MFRFWGFGKREKRPVDTAEATTDNPEKQTALKYLIVGLGNIGGQYEATRHNIGFLVLDAFAEASNTSFTPQRYGAVAEARFKGRQMVLLKPSTYMNLSGNAVRYWMQAEKIPVENVFVVVDDIALPFGTLRIRTRGSDGGHNGLKSTIETLGTDAFTRLRFGIGGDFPKGRQVDHVLGVWSEEEAAALPPFIDKTVGAIRSFVTVGPERTMNTFNTRG